MRSLFLFSFLFGSIFIADLSAQILSPQRSTDWSVAGNKYNAPTQWTLVKLSSQQVDTTGLSPINDTLNDILSKLQGPTIIELPAGRFQSEATINLPSNVQLKGQGSKTSTLLADLNTGRHAIYISGQAVNTDTAFLTAAAVKDSTSLYISTANTKLQAGDWVQLIQNDSASVTSSWAIGSIGQLVKIIDRLPSGKLRLNMPLRLSSNLSAKPYLKRITPVENTSVSCLKIERLDDVAPVQGCNIAFKYAVNCTVKAIESQNCTFSHIVAERSSNLHIHNCYFYDGFTYGSGGRAYGVTLQFTTGACLIENNIFKHLRHAMLLQAGANGNVFSYNYVFDSYWSNFPTNSGGDITLHGNGPFLNLFEQNIVQNIIIDNSHGPNGRYNTFFRNRAELYGLYFSATNSPSQNIIANEITKTTAPYSLVNFRIQGSDHFLHANNNKGTITPASPGTLVETSFYYTQTPSFLPANSFAKIGYPNSLGTASIPAQQRVNQNNLQPACTSSIISSFKPTHTPETTCYPSFNYGKFTVTAPNTIQSIQVFDALGKCCYSKKISQSMAEVSITQMPAGIYWVRVQTEGIKQASIHKIIKN